MLWQVAGLLRVCTGSKGQEPSREDAGGAGSAGGGQEGGPQATVLQQLFSPAPAHFALIATDLLMSCH